MDRLPLRWRIRAWLAEHLPRWLAVFLAIRRLSPELGERYPAWSVNVAPASDTGGGYRAKHRQQDPAKDPTEPYGSESSSTGSDHAWSGCTMSSGADAIAYQQPRGSVTPWGGDLRHRQSDLSGGTDLYDLRTAWAELGETLTIRTGSGWSAVAKAHDEGRAIVAQGTGNVPGSQTFDGGHACCIAPETHSDGRWLFGDPLASDWQWVSPSSIHAWMDAMSSGCYYAVGEAPPAPAPTPPPTPAGPSYEDGYAIGRQDGYRVGRQDGEAHGELVGDATRADLVFHSWQPGGPFDPELAGARWGASAWSSHGEPPEIAEPWASWPMPLAAVWRAQYPAAWGTAAWAGAVWRA